MALCTGYVEFDFRVDHGFPTPNQKGLLAAIRTGGLGKLNPVFKRMVSTSAHIKATADGIIMEYSNSAYRRYLYCAAHRNGDFYCLSSFPEDSKNERTLNYRTQIAMIGFALLFSESFYVSLGAAQYEKVFFNMHYFGLQGRILASRDGFSSPLGPAYENEISMSDFYTIDFLKGKLISIMKRFAEEVFLLLDLEIDVRSEECESIIANIDKPN